MRRTLRWANSGSQISFLRIYILGWRKPTALLDRIELLDGGCWFPNTNLPLIRGPMGKCVMRIVEGDLYMPPYVDPPSGRVLQGSITEQSREM